MPARSSPAARAPRRKSWRSWRPAASRSRRIRPRWASSSRAGSTADHALPAAPPVLRRQDGGRAGHRGTLAMQEFLTSIDWAAVGQIIMIDLLLGGDNAVVIPLA